MVSKSELRRILIQDSERAVLLFSHMDEAIRALMTLAENAHYEGQEYDEANANEALKRAGYPELRK